MKLNTDFYKDNKEELMSNDEKNIIESYIEKYKNNCYEENMAENVTEKEIYYLSSCSQNILNWYQFKSDDSILEIGGNLGQLTEIFTGKCKKVTTIEPNLEKARAIAKRYENCENLEVIVRKLGRN